jgi:hypothetical protein
MKTNDDGKAGVKGEPLFFLRREEVLRDRRKRRVS